LYAAPATDVEFAEAVQADVSDFDEGF